MVLLEKIKDKIVSDRESTQEKYNQLMSDDSPATVKTRVFLARKLYGKITYADELIEYIERLKK